MCDNYELTHVQQQALQLRAAELEAENVRLRGLRGRERLTGRNHKGLGFHTYDGPLNPYDVPLTLGELALSVADTPGYSAKAILQEVFARLAEYEDVLQALEGGGE